MKKTLTLALTLFGVALFCFLTLRAGIHPIVVTLSKVGLGGFGLLIAGQLVLDVGLGCAWKVAVPEIAFLRLVAARAVRDAAGTCLPFSQLGGMILGVRATVAGHPRLIPSGAPLTWPEAVAATLVDITTEVLAMIVFVILAILCLIGHQDAGRFIWPLLIGMGLLSLGMAGFVWTQQQGGTLLTRAAHFFARHISEGWQGSLIKNTQAFRSFLDRLWSRPGRIAGGSAVHLLCWCGSAGLAWLGLLLLGAHLTYFDAVSIEGVVCGIMAAGFMVPAALGVQEGAYVALGLVFGISADIMLSLSLLRRGREIVVGIPILLLWQLYEMYHLRQQKHQPPSQPSP
ncbi:lysylphosphatidylglycerol synthase domain-containing protein [Oecophyllibacter saccharovorans]|uniref:lysylphosphatidylglycerol synthase domain-containing protein n=1 Tax=Oecophyllibacter saccharovorans TaxID=2558360 RepID=UPI00117372F2|nr:lysylphosphatidylglycerol synthase domain-containing protein [Oecophyllibacter saccharovorans]TPW36760.1 HpnL family protein [Oecophyllibacter saccharovorans]